MSKRFLLLHKKNVSRRLLEEQEPDYTTLKYHDGIYNGNINATNQRHGHGIMKYTNGREYIGEWQNDKREGKGKLTFGSDTYEGTFLDNKMNGRGVYKCSNGNTYDGKWKDGLRDGWGVYKYKNGNVFKGNWRNGVKHEVGVFTYSDGCKRVNSFENGVWKDGVHVSSDGSRVWKMVEISLDEARGVFHSMGVLDDILDDVLENNHTEEEVLSCVEVTEDGIIKDPITLPKIQTKTYPDGTYKGTLNHKSQREGTGTMSYTNHQIYQGEWKNDKRNGRGTLTSPNGKTYTGEFQNDAKEGKGTIQYPNGTTYTGYWKYNKMNGIGKYSYDKQGWKVDYCYFSQGKAVGMGVRFDGVEKRVFKTLNDKCVCEISVEEGKVLMEQMGFPT